MSAFNIVINQCNQQYTFSFQSGKIEQIKRWRGVGWLSISDAGRGHKFFTEKALCPEGAK